MKEIDFNEFRSVISRRKLLTGSMDTYNLEMSKSIQ